jgi:hypothetical protein
MEIIFEDEQDTGFKMRLTVGNRIPILYLGCNWSVLGQEMDGNDRNSFLLPLFSHQVVSFWNA